MSTSAPPTETPAAPVPATRRSGRVVLLVALAVLLLAVVPGIVVPTLLCRPAPPALDDLGLLPPFRLVDHTGATITEAELRGHPTIINAIFTRCDTVCPMATYRMQTIQTQTSDRKGAGIKLLSFTVDPAHDTPAVLSAYADRFHADGARWRFVTGPEPEVRAFVETALWYSTDRTGTSPSGAPEIAHQQHFLLLDSSLRIRGTYDSTDPQRLDALQRAARYLLRTGQ